MANAAGDQTIGSGGGRNEFSAEGYWTAERLARATPVAMPTLVTSPGNSGGEQPATTGEAPPTRSSGHVPGQPPPGHREETSLAPHLEADFAGEYGPGGARVVAHPLNYPWSAVGKLTYTRNGNERSGSAVLIRPNILLTAGHCIHDKDDGGQSTNVSFFPGWGWRNKDTDPAYQLHCSWFRWWNAWANFKNQSYDYALAWIDGNPGGLIGWLGYTWGQSLEDRTWTAVGYPAPKEGANADFMYAATGVYAPNSRTYGPPTNYLPWPGQFGLTNDHMGHGSSGAPWISQGPWAASGVSQDQWMNQRYHVNGLNSVIRQTQGDTMVLSPYFTREVDDLVKAISNPANRR
jgi:V8-like Glu-specific endopeptidase